MPLSGWCRIQGCYTLAEQGRVGNPQSAVEELANFCDVSSSRELRTNPPVIDGSTKPWNAGGVATSPEGRCAGSCSLEGLVACQPRPKARTTVPAADLAGRPDLIKRDFTADAPARKLVGDITYIHTREGFVYPAGRDGAATRKELLATP